MTATALARRDADAPALAAVPATGPVLSREHLEAVKDVIAPGASDVELELFYHVCTRTRLDPFARQIYALRRRAKNDRGEWEEKITFQVSIDGFRLQAQRSGEYEGQTAPEFAGPDGTFRPLWLDTKPPVAARVGVYRAGFREPLYAVALWREYVQTTRDGSPSRMWREKPTILLAKCAEALALRKAFPAELSGLYVAEEMARDETPHDEPPAPAPVRESKPKPAPALPAAPALTPEAALADPGAVVIPAGRGRGRPLREIPTAQLLEWRDLWTVPAAKANVVARFGEPFVLAVYAEIERRPDAVPATDPLEALEAAEPPAPPTIDEDPNALPF